MKRVSAITLGLLIIGLAGVQDLSTPSAQSTAEWTTLFGGSSLDGWNAVGDANWELADGGVQADSGNGFLVTPASYADFQLRLEFWVDEEANSGVFVRCADPETITADNSYEVNIYDKRADQSYRTGGIVNVAVPYGTIHTGGRWNTYDIRAEGSRLTVILNGLSHRRRSAQSVCPRPYRAPVWRRHRQVSERAN